MTDTLDRLRTRLHREFDIPLEALQPAATLESLEVDSLRMIEVVFGVEEEFDISLQADHNELRTRLTTLGDLVAYVDEVRAAKGAA